MAEPTSAMEEGSSSKEPQQSSSSVMKSSVLRFKNVNFVVNKERYILSDVSGAIKWGHVLAVMGPSGAGKTTLINALTLNALYGTAAGVVTLNGAPMTDSLFKSHCYVVQQHDKHWDYLTCRETLSYAAELYNKQSDKEAAVDELIRKMGLQTCASTRNARLSGGQRRRLSIAISLLKQPTVLFLDEPTSGLDAAAASAIMQEIVRVARQENLIVFCTIHQPSTKVYNGFDEVMILSRGRQAFYGDVNDAIPYFESIGHPCPAATNPAEFFLDLVNSDFSDEAAVSGILDTWEEMKPGSGSSSHQSIGVAEADGQQGVTILHRTKFAKELGIMLRRHAVMIVRDPILYIGRCGIFLITNLIFAFVYWNARDYTQDQSLNKQWVFIWFIAVPSNMGVVAVYTLNDEFKSVLRETKNGMVSGISYVVAKSILVLPIMFLFSIVALGIPLFVVQDAPIDALPILTILFAAIMFLYESLAECLAVWTDDPILGMLQFMNFWFSSFLFGGFLIPLRDLYWPFKLFYYIMPYAYFARSSVYELFVSSDFDACNDIDLSAVCVNSTEGVDVLEGLGRVVPLYTSDDNTYTDLVVLVVIGCVYKVLYIAGVLYKTSQTSKFVNEKTLPQLLRPELSSKVHENDVPTRQTKELVKEARRNFKPARVEL